MKKINKLFLALSTLMLIVAGCKKENFVEENIDPSVVATVDPSHQFLEGTRNLHNWDFEWFYDNYRALMPWLQYTTAGTGNQQNFTATVGQFNYRYERFYSQGGPRVFDAIRLIDQMPAEQRAARQNQRAIAQIVLDYFFFYVADINGSVPYTEAFQARYENNLTPKFNTQREVFEGVLESLKTSIQTLKTTHAVAQTSYGNYDQYYFGDATKWVKAANALRLRIAMRMMERDPNRAKAIITEVLGSPASDLMASNADTWTFYAPANFTSGGNWSPEGFRASKSLVDFMLKNSDPRLRIFYTKNMYTQENFDLAKAQGKLPAGAVYNNQRYVGSYASPDSSSNPANVARFYTPRTIQKGTNANFGLDTLSNLNYRLFQPAYQNGPTTSIHHFPLLTYADFALMRAELAARAVTTESAMEWYNKGVQASLEYYGRMAEDARLLDYYVETGGSNVTAPTQAEITAYLNAPDVKFDPAKALDQIISQQYLNFFKQSSEAWALWKRTDMPNENSVVKLERLTSNGAALSIARRAPRPIPIETDRNFQNIQSAISEMQQDPDYGSGPQDIFGRVWWDKK